VISPTLRRDFLDSSRVRPVGSMGYMDIFIAWWAVGTLSAMWAAWHTGELFQGYNWMYCLIAGLSGPLFWTKRLKAWLQSKAVAWGRHQPAARRIHHRS
jgi:hypothetical protein